MFSTTMNGILAQSFTLGEGLSVTFGVFSFLTVCIWQISKHKFKYDQACKEVMNLGEELSKTSKNVINLDAKFKIVIDMLSAFIGAEKKVIETNSPVGLTEEGSKIIFSSGFADTFEEQKFLFMAQLKKRAIKYESDLDQACIDLMDSLKEKRIIEQLSLAAYENGLPLPVVQKMCAIFMREQLKKEMLPL